MHQLCMGLHNAASSAWRYLSTTDSCSTADAMLPLADYKCVSCGLKPIQKPSSIPCNSSAPCARHPVSLASPLVASRLAIMHSVLGSRLPTRATACPTALCHRPCTDRRKKGGGEGEGGRERGRGARSGYIAGKKRKGGLSYR